MGFSWNEMPKWNYKVRDIKQKYASAGVINGDSNKSTVPIIFDQHLYINSFDKLPKAMYYYLLFIDNQHFTKIFSMKHT